MDAYIAESSTLRERTSDGEERLRKKKQQRERNYGVKFVVVISHKIYCVNFQSTSEEVVVVNPANQPRRPNEMDEDEEKEVLKYGAKHVKF